MASYSSIKQASDAYFSAKKRGDAAGMKAANDAANKIRASQGQKAQYATGDISGVAAKSGSKSTSRSSVSSGVSNAMNALKNAISNGIRGSSGGSSNRTASGGSTGGSSGMVTATLPDGSKVNVNYRNGHVTDNLPSGSIIHTAGGDYRVTGGSAGNYSSSRVGSGSFNGSATGVTTWDEDQNAIRARMNANSQEWHTATPERKKELEAENKALAYRLGGSVSFDSKTGTWSGDAEQPLRQLPMDIPNYEEWMANSGYGAAMDNLAAQNEAYQRLLEANAAAQENSVNQGYDDAARQAYIAYMQSRRTLPQRMSAAGQNGGLADSQQIALDTELQNNQTSLNNQRQEALQQLKSALEQNKLSAQQNYLGTLAGMQQNAASGYQNYYQNARDEILQQYYSQQELASQSEQQKWERAYSLLQTLGYADSQIAQILGIKQGTTTNDADYRAAQLQMALLGL